MKCLYCNNEKFKTVYTNQDLILIKCMKCKLVTQSNFLDSSKVNYSQETHGIKTRNELKTRSDIILKIITNHPNGTVLDVGCGYGGFMQAIQSLGGESLKVIGVEPNQTEAQHCRKLGLKCINNFFDKNLLTSESVDVITFMQVLEHFQNPNEAIKTAYSLLRPGGWLIIEVPNYNNPKTLIYRATKINRIVKYDFIKSHLFYFTPPTLSNFVVQAGFKIMDVKTGRYSLRYDSKVIIRIFMSIIDSIANRLKIGGILLYAQKPDK